MVDNDAMEPSEPTAERADWLIDVQCVSKKYCRDLRRSLWYGVQDVARAFALSDSSGKTLREHEFWALKDVTFQVSCGDSVGLLGSNGAGKSTLMKMITGQRRLTRGSISTRGRIVALTELGLGFDPALTGRENAYVNAAVHGFNRREFQPMIDEIIDFSGVREFIDAAVQTYSSGMKARLGFAVATHLNPDVLIVDEVLAVGDLDFKRQCVRHIQSYVRAGGSMLLTAHDPYLVQSMCNRVLILDHGRLVFDGPSVEGVGKHFQLAQRQQHSRVTEHQPNDGPEESSELDRLLGESGATLFETSASSDPANDRTDSRCRHNLEPTSERPVVIDCFQVVPETGTSLVPGAAALVKLHYRSLIETDDAGWGFMLLTGDLQICIASCNIGMDGELLTLLKGANRLVCRLPELILVPGVYAIKGGIGELSTGQGLALKGYDDPPDYFTVETREDTRHTNWQRQMSTLVTMKAEWLS
jgi:lipopolysaccharide transport system ATP-binding protein